MSYHLDMDTTGKPPKIEMPPLPQEEVQAPEPQQYQELVDEPVNVEYDSGSEQEVEVAEEPEEVAQVTSSPKNERNIRYLREKAEQADKFQRERDEAMRVISELTSRQQIQQQPKHYEEPEEDESLAPDDLVEAKYLKKYDKKLQQMQDKLNSYEQQSNNASVDSRLRNRFPDIDKVLSKDNIAILNQDYPEIAETLRSTGDLYNKAVSAYTMIKKLGIEYDDVYVEEKVKTKVNAAKPRPLTSISPQQGESPLSRANAFSNGLTPELQEQLRREMMDAKKRI